MEIFSGEFFFTPRPFPTDSRSIKRWHHVVRQMIQKLGHRIDSFPARGTASDNNALSALRDRWRLVNEVRQIMTLNFFLDCSEQNGFLHGRTPSSMCRGRERKASITSSHMPSKLKLASLPQKAAAWIPPGALRSTLPAPSGLTKWLLRL